MLKIVKNYIVRGQLISVFNLDYIFYVILEILKIVFPSFCNLMTSSIKVEVRFISMMSKKVWRRMMSKSRQKQNTYSDYSNEIFMERSSILSDCYQDG